MERKSIIVIEGLDGGIPKHENTNVRVTGTTFDGLNILKGLLGVIGKVHEVVHYRQGGTYLTFLVGSEFDIVVDSALTSGYVGTGSNGFVSMLKEIGINEDEAKKFVLNKQVNGENYIDAKIIFSFL